ncbi:MAG: decaprenyl-phosphate phosphoribosyltransferase [Clostridiales bacterium]|nr:decaprenyl-phosphate phosphoribosyltransferase [Clostridiales bacterium]
MKNKLDLIGRLLRVRQWIKNLFIFAPIVFAQKAFDGISVIKVLVAAALFCLLTSCVYILNDIEDMEKDVLHPIKKLRPIASGEVSKKNALILVAILLPVSTVLGVFLEVNFGVVMILYFLNNYLYSRFLKHMVIVDVLSIAIGFVLRVIAGAEVIDIYVSPWILICTLFLALFLGLNKRKNEMLILGSEACKFRENLDEYSLEFIDNMLSAVIAMTLIAYSLYTFFSHNDVYMMTSTIPVVIYGIFRYQYLVYRKNEGGSPEDTILSDRALLATIAIWGLIVMLAIYF